MNEVFPLDVESNGKIISINNTNAVEVEPTDEELITLEHICDHIPLTAWLIMYCEICEAVASMGTFQIMQNYIQFPIPGPNSTQPGALGRGQQTATALNISYNFFAFMTPIAGAIVADQFWGRYKTLVAACLFYLVGLVVLVLTSIPSAIEIGVALPGLILSMILMGLGMGGFKAAGGPFMAEQYTRTKPVIKG